MQQTSLCRWAQLAWGLREPCALRARTMLFRHSYEFPDMDQPRITFPSPQSSYSLTAALAKLCGGGQQDFEISAAMLLHQDAELSFVPFLCPSSS